MARRVAFVLLLTVGVTAAVAGIVLRDWERVHQFSSQV